MKRKVWVSGVGVGPSASNRARTRRPSGVPSGSLVRTTWRPRPNKCCSSRAHCVDLPDPSTPSTVISTAGIGVLYHTDLVGGPSPLWCYLREISFHSSYPTLLDAKQRTRREVPGNPPFPRNARWRGSCYSLERPRRSAG